MEELRRPKYARKACTAFAGALAILIGIGATRIQDSAFTLEPKGSVTAKLGYYPVLLKTSAEKPSQIVKEPTYRVAPKYGIIHLGNGPKSDFVVALDEPANADWKIYIDKNRNGDLTDDG